MEMTINKAMEILTAENFNGYSMSEIIEARNMMLDIMKKYQKIQEIIDDWNNQKISNIICCLDIKEVMEDGSNSY